MLSIFSKWNGKINRVSRRHRGRAVRGALSSLFSSSIDNKNAKRGYSIYGGFGGKRGKFKF